MDHQDARDISSLDEGTAARRLKTVNPEPPGPNVFKKTNGKREAPATSPIQKHEAAAASSEKREDDRKQAEQQVRRVPLHERGKRIWRSLVEKGSANPNWSVTLSIHTVADAYYAMNQADAADQSRLPETFLAALKQFEQAHGSLQNSHFCSSYPAAVLYTRDATTREDKIHLSLPSATNAPSWITELLLECHALYIEVRQALPPGNKGRTICMEMLFVLVAQLLRLMEVEDSDIPGAEAAEVKKASRPVYERQLSQIRTIFVNAAQQMAQGWYFSGMVLSLAIFSFLTWIAANWMPFPLTPPFLSQQESNLLISCLVIGAIGAVISVMQRMTSGKLSLKYRAGAIPLLLVGAFRPVIGAVIAVVIYILLMTSLLPISTPEATEPTQLFYFFCAVAFFAGFSERWAQDMLAAGQKRIAAPIGSEST